MDAENEVKTGNEAFLHRLRCEGREIEYREKIRQMNLDTGLPFVVCSKTLRKQMGFVSDKEELRLYQERILNGIQPDPDLTVSGSNRNKSKLGEAIALSMFDEALQRLPHRADRRAELDWVASHPAMIRAHRSNGRKSHILTANDVLNTSAGPAPSKAAVNMLQHWVTDPNEFFKQSLAEQRKVKDSDESKNQLKDKTVSEIEALLNSLE
jgi:hypothetical protein